MKKISLVLSLTAMLLVSGYQTFAQSPALSVGTQPQAERSLQELVNEVRQLRAEVRRVGLAAYKGQVLVERLRLQQAEVGRLSRELSEAQEKLEEAQAKQQRLKELIKLEERQVEVGVKSGKELGEWKAELETTYLSEQRLTSRASQLTSELQEARAKLAELELQLNAIDHEVIGR